MPRGRPREFDLKIMVRVTADLSERVKAVLREGENIAGFFRATAEREVERRERAVERKDRHVGEEDGPVWVDDPHDALDDPHEQAFLWLDGNLWVDDPHDSIDNPHEQTFLWWIAVLLESARYRAVDSPPAGMPDRLIGTSHTPLPPFITTTLELVRRDLARGKPPQIKHAVWILDAVGQVAAWEDKGRARAVMQVMGLFSERERGRKTKALQPVVTADRKGKRPEATPTDELNLLVNGVKLIDRAIDSRCGARMTEPQAVRLALSKLRRRLVDIQETRLRTWRKELRQGRASAGAMQRYKTPLPVEAGTTPDEQLAWLLERLDRDTEQ